MEANSLDRTSQTSSVCCWLCVPGVRWDHLLWMSVQCLLCQGTPRALRGGTQSRNESFSSALSHKGFPDCSLWMCASAPSQDSHGGRSCGSLLGSAVWMAITAFFSNFYFSQFSLPWLAFHHSLNSCLFPDPHPTALPWLALSSSLFLCPQNKATSHQQWLWHDLREPTEVFPPLYSFHLLRGAAQMCLGEKADHSHFSKETQSDLEMLCAFLDNFHYTRA